MKIVCINNSKDATIQIPTINAEWQTSWARADQLKRHLQNQQGFFIKQGPYYDWEATPPATIIKEPVRLPLSLCRTIAAGFYLLIIQLLIIATLATITI